MSRGFMMFAAILLHAALAGNAVADQECELDGNEQARDSQWLSKGLPWWWENRWEWSERDEDEGSRHWDGDLIDLPYGYWGGRTRNSRIHPVTRELPLAVQMLAKRSLVPLTQDQVVRFSGMAAADRLQDKTWRLKPYLVRAVFPAEKPDSLGVRWRGNTLYIRASEHACYPFTNHPIIVFLERRPKAVKVAAYYYGVD